MGATHPFQGQTDLVFELLSEDLRTDVGGKYWLPSTRIVASYSASRWLSRDTRTKGIGEVGVGERW